MRLRDGRTFWPLFGIPGFLDIAQMRQFQVIQHSYDELEVKLGVERELTNLEQARLGEHVPENLGFRFWLIWTFLPDIPHDQGGKFEEFVYALDA